MSMEDFEHCEDDQNLDVGEILLTNAYFSWGSQSVKKCIMMVNNEITNPNFFASSEFFEKSPRVLTNISNHFKAGTMTGILGLKGSGKTSLLYATQNE